MTPQQKYNLSEKGRKKRRELEKRYRRTEKWRKAHREHAKRYRLAHPEKQLWNEARRRAKRKGVPFTIVQTDVVIPARCPVLDIPLTAGSQGWHRFSPTLDRFKPELGYVPGNVRVISHRANQLKNDATIDELDRVIAFMRLHA